MHLFIENVFIHNSNINSYLTTQVSNIMRKLLVSYLLL